LCLARDREGRRLFDSFVARQDYSSAAQLGSHICIYSLGSAISSHMNRPTRVNRGTTLQFGSGHETTLQFPLERPATRSVPFRLSRDMMINRTLS